MATLPAGTLPAGTYQVNATYVFRGLWSVAGSVVHVLIGLGPTSNAITQTITSTNIYNYGPVGYAATAINYDLGVSLTGVIIIPNATQIFYYNGIIRHTGTAVVTNGSPNTGHISFVRIA